jgi:hypothetical protein
MLKAIVPTKEEFPRKTLVDGRTERDSGAPHGMQFLASGCQSPNVFPVSKRIKFHEDLVIQETLFFWWYSKEQSSY